MDTHDHEALPGRVYHWTCDDGTAVQMDNLIERDAIVLHLPEGMVTLPHLESASGARYGNEEIVFWTHDSEQALFERKPAQATRCVISAVE